MNVMLLGVIIFIMALTFIELIFYGYRMFRYPDRTEVRRRLRMSMETFDEEEAANLYKKNVLSDIPFLNYILPRLPGIEKMRLVLEQANVQFTLGFLVLLSLTIGLMGYMAASTLGGALEYRQNISIGVALVAAYLPTFYVRYKKKKRMAKFEQQLPDALEFIARALRSGHAFTSGMKLAADEFSDPIGPEFNETLDEINFGINVAEALKNLAKRVDCPDLKFFVVSVILQRETGGNLAELMENLAHLIRERFKLRGKVQTLTAEGRLSAKVLLALPTAVAIYLMIFEKDFFSPMYTDPLGRMFLMITVAFMIVGFIIIQRIVKLEI